MYTINFLANLVENHQILVYALIFLGIIIEGEFILLCTGVLVHLGALNFYFALPFVFMAGVCKTFLCYRIRAFMQDKRNQAKTLLVNFYFKIYNDKSFRYCFCRLSKDKFQEIFESRTSFYCYMGSGVNIVGILFFLYRHQC